MKITTLLASSAALAAIALVTPAPQTAGFGFIRSAEAANVSVNISLFYSGLGRYGDWVDHRGMYVFVPVVSDRNWRPYREGHWVYARGYGWTWVSREPFGWATYHYGRWGFDREIGWYWVPGTRWAPAWVSWRRSGNHVAWAPLPPWRDRGTDVSISISVNDIPDYYWVAVPTRHFLDRDLTVVVIKDERERHRIVRETEFAGTVNIENNIIVNNIIDVNFVEKNTGKKVKEVEVKEASDPTKAKSSDEAVAVFNGTLEQNSDVKPPKVKDVGEVKKNQAKVKQDVEEEAGAELDKSAQPAEEPSSQNGKKVKPEDAQGTPPADQPATAQDGAAKKPKSNEPDGQATTAQPSTDETAQPQDKKAKNKQPGQAQQQTEEPQSGEQVTPPAETKKKAQDKKAAPAEAEQSPADTQPAGQQQGKKKKAKPEQNQTEESAAPPADNAPAAADETAPAAAGKKGKKAKACDPAVETCDAQ
ncbi:DUF6600 domain-containing protein [Aestuariivirga sp.]|uniref:DUF6600 domain-containing protein n=1 Tax=Aestuariivirga sp. TaxID=2650926 RepID=UPI0039E2DCCC